GGRQLRQDGGLHLDGGQLGGRQLRQFGGLHLDGGQLWRRQLREIRGPQLDRGQLRAQGLGARSQVPDQLGDGLLALADLGLRLARLLLGLARPGLAPASDPDELLLYFLPDGSGVDHGYSSSHLLQTISSKTLSMSSEALTSSNTMTQRRSAPEPGRSWTPPTRPIMITETRPRYALTGFRADAKRSEWPEFMIPEDQGPPATPILRGHVCPAVRGGSAVLDMRSGRLDRDQVGGEQHRPDHQGHPGPPRGTLPAEARHEHGGNSQNGDQQ